jgi:two-component system sensor histidine kinase QseC
MKSIRLYLVLALVSAICLANFIAAVQGYRDGMAAGDRLLDKQLIEMSQALEQLHASATTPPAHLYGESRVFQIWRDGVLQHRSAFGPDTPLGELEPGFHFASHNGLRWRTYVLRTHENGDDTAIVAAQRYDIYAQIIERMVLEATLPIFWIVPVIAALIWLIVGLGLKPLRTLAATLQSRRAGELQPVASEGYPQELGVVITSVNQLMERLAEAFAREQRFAADAAHELRTPLAAIKINLHNLAQQGGIDRTVNHETLQNLTRAIERMGHSIEQILALHRFTPEQLLMGSTRCDLRQLAQAAIIDLYDACRAKQQSIELEADAAVIVEGGEFALQTLLRNLIDNASKYTPPGGSILLAVAQRDGEACIAVDDSGPGIPEADRQRVFDRFYRVGGDRHASGVTGSGLGLSIVAQIVRLHGGRVALQRSPRLGGLRVEILLPLRSRQPLPDTGE